MPTRTDTLTQIIEEIRAEADNARQKAQYYRQHKPRRVSRADVYTHALISTHEEQRAYLGTLALKLEEINKT